LRWFHDYRFAGTGGRILSCDRCHNDVLSGPTLVCSGPLMRLEHCSAGNKRRGKTPKRGAVGHLVNDAPLAIQPYTRTWGVQA
jgi:hypothetical protein